MNLAEYLKNLKEQGSVPVFLAPMAGVTDAPFREMVASFGATAVVSEMVSSEALVRNSEKTYRRLPEAVGQVIDQTESENSSDAFHLPLVISQIMGADPAHMAESAKINEGFGVDAIDINMGCPARKIVSNDSGSALMRDENLALKIVESVVDSVNIPVTLKMRLGWDNDHINFLSLAKKFENAGVQMLTIHCRTRNQMYSGTADWSAIKCLSEAVKIPYLCNGDIHNSADARVAMEQSGATGVMIGRAALGKPWLLRQIMDDLQDISEGSRNSKVSCEPQSAQDRLAIIMRHFRATLDFYGEYHGLRVFRKHFCWYSAGMSGASGFREAINKIEEVDKAIECVQEFYEGQ